MFGLLMNMLSPCLQRILYKVTVILFDNSMTQLTYDYHVVTLLSFGHTFSATTSFQFVSGRVCIMVFTRAGAITAAAKAVSKSRENEKRRKSAERKHKWRERQSAERRSEIRQTNRTGHADGRACLSAERRSEIRQTNRTGHAEVFAGLSEERRSEIRQTNRRGHADGRARLSEERHAERRAHHDMDVVDEEKDSCDNCH